VRSSNDLRCTTAWATARLDFFVIPDASLDASVVILFFLSVPVGQDQTWMNIVIMMSSQTPLDLKMHIKAMTFQTLIPQYISSFFFQKAAKPWIILDFSVKQIHHLFLLYNLYHDFVRVVQICCLCR
jgi:hypothetical protein